MIFGILGTMSFLATAQDVNTEPKYGITFSGFVKTDVFYDSRQSTSSTGLREGHFYLFPDNVLNDANNNDLNANPSFHILNIQSRLKGDITAPDVFGAKTTGVIEGEFFGTSESDVNGFRLRHSFLKLDWAKTSLVVGQTWHPMFPAECFPGTISFNTGVPFTPFSRNPQIKLTKKLGNASISVDAYAQRDFTSTGPDGISNKYMKNSGLPGFDLQLRAPMGETFVAWAGVDYKVLRPEIKTTANFETSTTIPSMAAYATMKIKTTPVNVSLMAVYSQNGSDLMMIGGYAVSGVSDSATMIKTYTNISTSNIWMDLTTNGKNLSFGLFTGYSKNMGSKDLITGAVYGRGNNIDHLFRVSPRVSVTKSKVVFAAEVENTIAAYGTMQTDGKVINTNNVSNIRILLSAILKF